MLLLSVLAGQVHRLCDSRAHSVVQGAVALLHSDQQAGQPEMTRFAAFVCAMYQLSWAFDTLQSEHTLFYFLVLPCFSLPALLLCNGPLLAAGLPHCTLTSSYWGWRSGTKWLHM